LSNPHNDLMKKVLKRIARGNLKDSLGRQGLLLRDDRVLIAGGGNTGIDGIDPSQMPFDFSQGHRLAVAGGLAAVKVGLNFSAF